MESFSCLVKRFLESLESYNASNEGQRTSIDVWPFNDAPYYVKLLVPNWDDADWIAFIPNRYKDLYIPWVECGSFGCSRVSHYYAIDGEVVVGYHS